MAEYIDMNTHEILDDDDMHDRYDEWIDEVHGEVSIGNSTFSPAEILRELDPIGYRVGFSDFVDFDTQDGKVMELDDSPECEDCGASLTQDDVTESLGNYDRLVCPSCAVEDDDEE